MRFKDTPKDVLIKSNFKNRVLLFKKLLNTSAFGIQ